MKNKSYCLISLGCAKNTVNSQSMANLLNNAGFSVENTHGQAEFIIVNTCGFIKAARQESIDLLTELAEGKQKGQILIAAGCLPERIRHNILKEVPDIDAVLGSQRWMDILQIIRKIKTSGKFQEPFVHLSDNEMLIDPAVDIPRVAIQGKSAYLKVADGCRHSCGFCSIPLIKGTKRSRPFKDIIKEALMLQDLGINEINLIAQDTTDYGFDLGIKNGLAKLLEQLVEEIPEVPWIRVLYAYPGNVSRLLIETMAVNNQILPYLDMPLQHAHPDILRRMQRPADMEWVYKTIKKMRSDMPELALRSTFIVGYPGETEREFEYLLDFISEIRFDHLGAFTFSFETGTPSEPLGDPVPTEIKVSRMERLMLAQEKISQEILRNFKNSTLAVLIEGANDGISVGRSYRDAPEIDGFVFVEGEKPIGEFVNVQITDTMTHDLFGQEI
ncbi:MAG: 30S ribosomal protein S12 methylthiotransferase RimO [Anaerolineaceae bacterium]|nr:30S ribosomal protein S12 methylthiotransferase RimO [Anaerolineaceae bacterium]